MKKKKNLRIQMIKRKWKPGWINVRFIFLLQHLPFTAPRVDEARFMSVKTWR